MLGWNWFRSPAAHASSLGNTWLVMFLVPSMRHWGKARLRRSVGEVGTSWLGGHVLDLGRAADGLLAVTVPTGDLMLGPGLG